jgi:hypothetical protein
MRRFLAVLLASLVLAPAALAQPWDGGATVDSPTEVALAQAIQPIAGRPVHVRCESPTDWQTLTAQIGGTGVVGYVLFSDGTPMDFMELGADTCTTLDSLLNSPPPEQCQTGTQTQTRYTIARVKVKKRWLNVRRPQSTQVPVYGACAPDSRVVYAVWTLAHEAVHLSGQRDEPTADCWGMQWIEPTAEALHVGPQAAHAMATFAWQWYQSSWQSGKPDYYSPECRDGGALDLHPDSSAWPS